MDSEGYNTTNRRVDNYLNLNLSICLVFTHFFITRNLMQPGETRDKFLLGYLILFGLLSLALSRYLHNVYLNTLITMTWVPLFFWNLITIEHEGSWNIFWLGFGGKVTLFAVIIFLLIKLNFASKLSSKVTKVLTLVISFLLLISFLVGILSFVHTRNSMALISHSNYVLNEIFAVSVGNFPYQDFIPQYQTYFSWMLAPFLNSFDLDNSIFIIFLVLNFFTLMIVFLSFRIVFMLESKMNRRIIFSAALIGFVFITQGPNREGLLGSISALHSVYPVRLLIPIILGYLLLRITDIHNSKKILFLFALGFISGLNVNVQTDFGLASYFALFLSLVIFFWITGFHLIKRRMPIFIFGSIGGFLIIPLIQNAAGHEFNFSYFAWFIRQFSSGFGAENIQYPGPGPLIMAIAVSVCIANGYLAFTNNKNGLQTEFSPEIVGLYFGAFTLTAMPYYLNRSFASGQLQSILLPLAIAIVALIISLSKSLESNGKLSRISSISIILLSLPIASIYLLPSPTQEIKRLNSSYEETVWPPPDLPSAKKLATLAEKYPALVYVGGLGNFIEYASGVENGSLFNTPSDAAMSSQAEAQMCKNLEQYIGRPIYFGTDTKILVELINSDTSNCSIKLIGISDPNLIQDSIRFIKISD